MLQFTAVTFKLNYKSDLTIFTNFTWRTGFAKELEVGKGNHNRHQDNHENTSDNHEHPFWRGLPIIDRLFSCFINRVVDRFGNWCEGPFFDDQTRLSRGNNIPGFYINGIFCNQTMYCRVGFVGNFTESVNFV